MSDKKYDVCWWPTDSGRCGKTHRVGALACDDHVKRYPLWPSGASGSEKFEARLADKTLVELHPAFVEKIRGAAALNSKTVDEVYEMWQKHTRENELMDQSPTWFEFCAWNKLRNPEEEAVNVAA